MLAYHHGLLTDARVLFELFEGEELCVVLYLLTLPCLVSPIIERQNVQIHPLLEKGLFAQRRVLKNSPA